MNFTTVPLFNIYIKSVCYHSGGHQPRRGEAAIGPLFGNYECKKGMNQDLCPSAFPVLLCSASESLET